MIGEISCVAFLVLYLYITWRILKWRLAVHKVLVSEINAGTGRAFGMGVKLLQSFIVFFILIMLGPGILGVLNLVLPSLKTDTILHSLSLAMMIAGLLAEKIWLWLVLWWHVSAIYQKTLDEP